MVGRYFVQTEVKTPNSFTKGRYFQYLPTYLYIPTTRETYWPTFWNYRGYVHDYY